MRSRLSIGLFLLFVVACQAPQGAGQQSAGPVGSGSAAPSGRTGGTIVWAKAGEPTGMDFQVKAQYVTGHISSRVYEPLVTVAQDGKLVPYVASSWDTPDDTTYLFHLRKGVRFSNGREMVAADVVATFQRLIDPKTTAQYASRFPISTVTAADDYTVTFKLSKAYGPFLAHMTLPTAGILPGKELKDGSFDINKDLLGTGPWVLEQHLQGESWTFKANPNYWQPGLPTADRLVILILNDDTARLAALREGRANVATFDGIDAARLLKDTPNVKAVTQETSDFNELYVQALKGTFANPHVRQAIGLAIDRDKIIQLALGGVGSPTTGTTTKMPDSCDPARLPKRDLAKAKELLAAAGVPNLSFQLLAPAGYGLEPIGEVVQSNLKEIGVTVNFLPLEIGGWSPRTRSGDFDASLSFDGAFVDNWIGLSTFSGAASPYRKAYTLTNPEFEGLLTQTSALPAGPARQQLFQKMCDIITTDANTFALTSRTNVVAYRTDKIQANIWSFEPAGNPIRLIDQYRVLSP